MLAIAFFVMILSLNLQGYIRANNKRQYHPFHFEAFARLSEEGAWLDAKSNWKCYIPVVLPRAVHFDTQRDLSKSGENIDRLGKSRDADGS